MLKNIKIIFISNLNKHPDFKKKLVMFIDFLFEFRKVTVGNITRNPAFLKHLLNSKVIAKPGTLSFGAIFNPGGLLVNNQILLLAKGQIIPWFKIRVKDRELYLKGNPIIFLLTENNQKVIKQEVITNLYNFPEEKDWAIEDTRLFYWKNKIMINHSLVIKGKINGLINQTSVLSALSVLDGKKNTITFKAIPKVDFRTQNFEKNWVYKERNDDLFLFYSINPFRVLKLVDEKEMVFESEINKNISSFNDPGGFGTMVSFSVNPIDLDAKYWLLIIHQIKNKISGRCYLHWAVLINKETLLPEKITSKPIFSGMGARGKTPGVRYISSILKINDEILFFAGEGDVYLTLAKKTISDILKDLVDL